ncbi:MAG: threonine synthase [Pseudomonadota bacterium]
MTQERCFVTHLECSMTGQHYPAGELHGLSEAGRPLLVRYDLEAMGAELDRDTLTRQPDCNGFWRYRDLLPLRDSANIVTLGEVMTPLIELGGGRLGLPAGEGKLWVKDEGRLPTGSFKARGLAVAIAMARELGVTRVAIPTNGNAGAALAAYASRAGMQSTVFCPDDTPAINVQEIALQGADTWLVNGLINDCGRIVGEGKEPVGWFDISTLKEPYRIEGKKTMGLELAEQLDWTLPDVIFYPTGGGTGLIGMWKAFAELKTMGWLSGKLPRMVAVQSTGCAPIVKAWEAGEEHAPVWEGAETVAAGIRVPVAVGDFLIIRAVNESGGFAMAVDDDHIMGCRDEVAAREGLLLCPEGAATYAAYEKALTSGKVSAQDNVVLFNCATGLKYPMPDVTQVLDQHKPVDYARFG